MNRDDIIRMARESGLELYPGWVTDGEGLENLELFAALVAAAEREKLARWMIKRSYATGHGDTLEDLLAELDWQIKEQREWQGLTEDDAISLLPITDYEYEVDIEIILQFAKNIEAKLKEIIVEFVSIFNNHAPDTHFDHAGLVEKL